MANLPESASFDAGVYQIETTDGVIGGVNGISNLQAKALANRTTWLKQQVDALNLLKGTGIAAFSAANSYAGGQQVIYLKNIWRANTSITPGAFNSANWTRQLGTAAELDATTDVPAALGTAAAGTAVTLARADHVHTNPTLGFLSDVTITANTNGEILRWNGSAWINNTLAEAGIGPVASPIFTGDPQAPKAAAGDNDVSIATTSFVQEAVGGSISIAVAGTGSTTLTATQVGYGTIYLTGVLTGARTLVMPAGVKGHWTFVNNTTGAFSLTIKYAAGTSVVVTQGTTSSLIGDAVNIGLQQTDFIDTVLRGVPLTPSPAAFDISQKVASTDFVNTKGFSYAGFTTISTSQTLPLSAAGGQIQASSSSATTLTLPLSSSVSPGTTFTINNPGTGTVTFTSTGADVIGSPNGPIVTGLQLKNGDSAVFIAGTSGWNLCGGTIALKYSNGMFGASLAVPGYTRLPSGLIIQGGIWSVAAATTTTFNLPLAFPNSGISIVASIGVPGGGAANAEFVNASQYKIQNTYPGAPQSGNWIAIGY